MYTCFILILILVLIFFIYESKSNKKRRQFEDANQYLNLDMREICKAIDLEQNEQNKQSEQNEQSVEEQLAKQLAEQKKINTELKLKYEDNTPSYRFSDTDRYVMDNNYQSADDKLMFKMKDVGSRAQESLVNRALFNKNSLVPYFEPELRSSNSEWWEDNDLEEAF